MTASYPNSIYAPRTKANRAGVVYDAAKTTVGFAEDITKLDDEVVAIERGTRFREGFLINGKIVVTVNGSGDINVAIKGLDGNDPSATNPVYCRIGGTIRTLVQALSCSAVHGYNHMNCGSAELATKEVDYFVYLGWSATDSAVTIGYSRIPYGHLFSDFNATYTHEKYLRTVGNTSATDVYVNIGRFTATLSAGAGYTFSVPTFTAINLIQYPIFETRKLSWNCGFTYSGGTTDPTSNIINAFSGYQIINNRLFLYLHSTLVRGTGDRTAQFYTIPFSVVDLNIPTRLITYGVVSGFDVYINANNVITVNSTMTGNGDIYITLNTFI